MGSLEYHKGLGALHPQFWRARTVEPPLGYRHLTTLGVANAVRPRAPITHATALNNKYKSKCSMDQELYSAYSEPMTIHALGGLAGSRRTLLQ